MRTMEQRLEEIRRRSETIIRRRKQRRTRVLAVCLPLALCVTLAWSWKQPQKDAPEEIRQESITETLAFPGAQAEIYRDGVVKSLTEKETVAQLQQLLQSVFRIPEMAMGAITEGPKSDDYSTMDNPRNNQGSTEAYTFRLTNEKGETETYRLEGENLRNVGTGEARVLTQAQLEALLAILRQA